MTTALDDILRARKRQFRQTIRRLNGECLEHKRTFPIISRRECPLCWEALKKSAGIGGITIIRPKSIIFSAEEVKAYLEGRKTMTRRFGGLAPINEDPHKWSFAYENRGRFFLRHPTFGTTMLRCPYGRAGDKLWVKETWGYVGDSLGRDGNTKRVHYLADGVRVSVPFDTVASMCDAPPHCNIRNPKGYDELDEDDRARIRSGLLTKWWASKRKIASIHMPRWASRFTLDITEVILGRAQEIEVGEDEGHIDWASNPWTWFIRFNGIQPQASES